MRPARLATALLSALPLTAMAEIPTGFVSNTTPTDWVTTISSTGGTANGYNGTYGTITFNDWGYSGPAGVGANDYQVGTGFDSSQIGQIQSVVTTSPDWLTPDTPSSGGPGDENYASGDLFSAQYNTPLPNASMDGQVNFGHWLYQTPAGSTFSNMQIDRQGNYFIAKDDMNFGFYDSTVYNNGVDPVQTLDSGINFQPYAISDAQGWCGSTMVSNPNGLEQMAGQVSFDFAFDVFLFDGVAGDSFSTQYVENFVMRSYGDYTVDMSSDSGLNQYYTGSAVGNNFNPVTGELDPDFQNQVSFLGAGVLAEGVWVLNDGTDNVEIVAEGTEGATWHSNSFGGYAFMLRADAERTLELISPEGHSIYVPTVVPVPAAAWLMASGLIGMIGVARRKHH